MNGLKGVIPGLKGVTPGLKGVNGVTPVNGPNNPGIKLKASIAARAIPKLPKPPKPPSLPNPIISSPLIASDDTAFVPFILFSEVIFFPIESIS
jgi:hypothetical protein